MLLNAISVVKKDMYPTTVLEGKLSILHAMKVMMIVIMVRMNMKLRKNRTFVKRKVMK
jgi:hypothetical protein